MKINQIAAVAFMVACGFTKAPKWDAETLAERLSKVPDKVAAEDVPEGHEEFYQKLVKAKGDIELVTDGAGEEKPKDKKSKKAPAEEPKDEKPSKKEKKSKDDADVEEKPKKEKKAATPKKDDVERDQFGCRKGSISYNVNEQVTDEWETEAGIAEKAGVTLDQARGRLYYGAEKGEFVRERLIRYRLPTPAEKRAFEKNKPKKEEPAE